MSKPTLQLKLTDKSGRILHLCLNTIPASAPVFYTAIELYVGDPDKTSLFHCSWIDFQYTIKQVEKVVGDKWVRVEGESRIDAQVSLLSISD